MIGMSANVHLVTSVTYTQSTCEPWDIELDVNFLDYEGNKHKWEIYLFPCNPNKLVEVIEMKGKK